MLRTAQLPPPRFAAGISANTGGFATRDLGVSPDRTHTGRCHKLALGHLMS